MSTERKETLSVWLREYRVGDEQGIIDCIRDEYGNSYVKAQWYRKTAIWENAVTGRDIFIVAQLPNGEIAATTALVRTQPQNAAVYEIAAQVVKKKYRGHGIARKLFEYGLKLLADKNAVSVYSQPVLFHDITQRLLCGLGFKAAGILPGMFDLQVLHHSYDNGRNKKMPLGIQVKAARGQTAGQLYLRERHRSFCMERCKELGVAYEIAKSPLGTDRDMPVKSRISYQYDRTHRYLEISIHTIGADIYRQLERLLCAYPQTGKTTATIFVNSNDQYAVSVYERLAGQGFFFMGIKPLCPENVYLIMHHAGETAFYLEDLKLNTEFKKIAEYIRKEQMR